MLIDWVTVFAQVVNFLVLVWLLRRYLFKPVLKVVEKREQTIKNQIESARKENEEAQKAKKDLIEAKESLLRHREELFAEAQTDAQKEKEALIKHTRLENAALKKSMQEKIQNEQKSLLLEANKRITDTVFHLAKKVLEEITQVKFQEAVVETFLRKINEISSQEKKEILEDISFSPAVSLKSAFELSSENRERVEKALKSVFSADISLSFATHPELVCGLELVTRGHKVSWNISDYIQQIQEKVCNP